MYKYLKRNDLTTCMRTYCLGDFPNCQRYQLKASGKPVPPALLPDGSFRPEDTVSTEPDLVHKSGKAGIHTLV